MHTSVMHIFGWKIKFYQSLVGNNAIASQLTNDLFCYLESELPSSSKANSVGFVIIYSYEREIKVAVNLWCGDKLSQYLLSSAIENRVKFKWQNNSFRDVDMWELAIQSYEYGAFTKYFNRSSGEANIEAYLEDMFSGLPTFSNQTLEPKPDKIGVVERFWKAWFRGDIDKLMDQMSENPAYLTSSGPGPGQVYLGSDSVRQGFARMMETQFLESNKQLTHVPQGDILFCESCCLVYWSLPGGILNGKGINIKGVDVITFDGNGKISIRDSYQKVWMEALHGQIS